MTIVHFDLSSKIGNRRRATAFGVHAKQGHSHLILLASQPSPVDEGTGILDRKKRFTHTGEVRLAGLAAVSTTFGVQQSWTSLLMTRYFSTR